MKDHVAPMFQLFSYSTLAGVGGWVSVDLIPVTIFTPSRVTLKGTRLD